MTQQTHDQILIIDFGSQVTQLIARRVREMGVYSEVVPFQKAAEAFARMKPGSLFVNTARGPLCDYDALTHALTKGHLGSAMLETFAVEPVPVDWPLLSLPNVTLTPHIAGASVRTVTYAAEQAAEEVRRYLAGEPQRNPC